MSENQIYASALLDFINGDKLFLHRARLILPYLVRQAKAGRPIYYSDLAAETQIPNPRNLNYPLGAIGNALIALGEKMDLEIPPIQCVVINKITKLPGDGIGWFINQTEFNNLSKTRKTQIINHLLGNIYIFQHWEKVLEELGLKEINIDIEAMIEKAKRLNFGGGESEHHRKFKQAVAKMPQLIGLDLKEGEMEYRLPSLDCIDILFKDKSQLIGVEVKSAISCEADILRGLFQCIKYKHLIESEQIIKNRQPDSRTILVLQGEFPSSLLGIKNMLGIEVIDKIDIGPDNLT